jgi:hypothetical protein
VTISCREPLERAFWAAAQQQVRAANRLEQTGAAAPRSIIAGRPPRSPSCRARRRRWRIAAGAGKAVLITAGVLLFRPQTPAGPARLGYAQLTDFAESTTSPAISPDGRMLAFIVGASTFYGPGQIYVKLLPDGEPVQLTQDSLYKMGPKFTPDGSRITYTTLGGDGWDTWVVPVLGGQPRLLLTNAEALTWSKDRVPEFRARPLAARRELVPGREIRLSRPVRVPLCNSTAAGPGSAAATGLGTPNRARGSCVARGAADPARIRVHRSGPIALCVHQGDHPTQPLPCSRAVITVADRNSEPD